MVGENTYYKYNEDTFDILEACIRVKNLKHINYGIKVAPRFLYRPYRWHFFIF